MACLAKVLLLLRLFMVVDFRADKYKSKDLWSEAQSKLSEALEENIQTGELKSEKRTKHGPLNLFALDLDPRLRLLAITLQKLQDKVNCILHDAENLPWEKWLVVSADLIKGLVRPVFMKWIEEEQALEKNQPYKLSDVVTRKLKEDDRIIRKFNSSGKAELYANLIFFLRFGFVRNPSYYDTKFFTEHGIQILEDMLIFLADGIASVYLELISVDGYYWYSEEMDNSSALVLCSLSTRALQKLRNELEW
ncbi:hypothetical protein LUZ62_090303 [Rhynchospora pubera]|uniref:Uncharacterized protein n=1 Tax=Rhynchospora pubera TaxID=906938 RepID=A0AAV8CL88_9POAL|nr:hypothetical protein LUZ62_090303 [Rhynchospora pubera]